MNSALFFLPMVVVGAAGGNAEGAGHGGDLLYTLALGLPAALILGYITQRLGLSPIVGYLLAGVVIGPHTPGIVADRGIATQLAHVGVILLMFGVGLHFHLKELWEVRWVAIPGAVGQSLVATLLGAIVGYFFVGSWTAGIVFGLAISVASTVVLVRVLSDNNDLHTPTGHIAIGWLVVEDLLTVVVLVLLPAFFPPEVAAAGAEAAPVVADVLPVWMILGLTALKIALLVVVVIVGGGWLIPWILEKIAETHSRELFTLSVLVIALGIAYGSAELFGVSMELGAFLAGMVVGRSEFSLRAASDALPMRDAFAVIFFISVGMLLDPNVLMDFPWPVLATMTIVLIGKPLAAFCIVRALRYPVPVAIAVGVALAQVGEFSFILAALGNQLKILPDSLNHAIVVSAIISISLNPLLYRLIDRIAEWLDGKQEKKPIVDEEEDDSARSPSHHAVIVGYGPVGRTLSRLLADNEIDSTIIEMNHATVRVLLNEGHPAIYGDASQRETLEAADIKHAATLILSASNLKNAAEVIRAARALNPRLRVFARAGYLREEGDLRQAGADAVFTGEGEVALAMTTHLLDDLGALPEQIDRERARVREELFTQDGEAPPMPQSS